MRKKHGNLKGLGFLAAFLILFVLADFGLGKAFDRYILSSGNFWLNDYEITRRDHPEPVWEKVFYGNSAVISGYREDLSESGYINFGVDYGSMTSLETILKSQEVNIGSELVVGLNWAAMFDNMETNPNYFWNRHNLEPYSYFQRDRLQTVLKGRLNFFLTGQTWADGTGLSQTKSYYYSCLSSDQLQEKVEIYRERYWSTGLAGCKENLEAMEAVAELCKKQGIRLRIVLMPWNPSVEKEPVVQELDQEIARICQELDVEFLDLSDSFEDECFHDLGHMNYEYGSHVFTEVIDRWLN